MIKIFKKIELLCHGTCLLLFFLGIYDVFFNYGENQCGMSYMWERPQYQQIPLTKAITEKYPQYGLYLYGEGIYFKVVSDLRLEGIPVLFIPGNGGSKNQARSVASFLLRKAENINWTSHFNVFTVDLNEELVALYGFTLNYQVGFIQECIKAIFKLYDETKLGQVKPKSVILIGHSMGGMIARGVVAIPGFNPNFINTIITLATPHVHPVINLDKKISYFYTNINSYWKLNCHKLQNITILSVSGGSRDVQVHEGVARLQHCGDKTITVSSTAVPRAWVSVDHQCAVWCKQIVLATTRSLFDMVDPSTKQISDDPDHRWKSLDYHFRRHPGFSSFSQTLKSHFKLLTSNAFKHVNSSRWSLQVESDFKQATYFVFNLKEMQANGMTLLVAKTTVNKDRWISLDLDNSFKSIADLSKRAILTPKYKVLCLNLDELISNGHNHVLVNVPKYSRNVEEFDVNFLRPDDYVINITVPNIFSNLWTLNYGYDFDRRLGKSSQQYYYRINLNGLHSIFHAYKVNIKSIEKTSASPLLQLQLPSSTGFTYGENGSIIIRLQKTNGCDHPVLHVYTDGNSEYIGNIRVQFIQILGQILKYDGACLPTMIVVNIMLTYTYQLRLMLFQTLCPTPPDAHRISAKPYKIQPFVNLIKFFFSFELFSKYWLSIGLPIPDAVELDKDHNTWFALLPLVLFLFAYEIFTLLIFIHSKFLSVFSVMGRIVQKEKPIGMFFFFTIHTVAMSLLAVFSGTFTLFYICTLSFFDLCHLKNTSMVLRRNENNIDAEYSIKTSMHFMWLCLAALSAPSGVAWFKGHNYAASDTFFPLAMFSSLLYMMHRVQNVNVVSNAITRTLYNLLYPLTILTSIVCFYSLYRISFCVLIFLFLHVIMQLFS